VPRSEPEFDVVVERDVMVTMRDGARMATDIYRPARDGRPVEGRLPVLLNRTPYNKVDNEEGSGYNSWFARRGYIAVTQDCRGCYRSEGDVRFLVPEAEDGFDTMAWIKEQSWAGEKVGAWGTSWAAWTQTSMAALGPDNLAAMVPNMSGSNAYTSSVRHGGALELRFLAWAFWHSALNTQVRLKPDPHIAASLLSGKHSFRDWLSRLPIRPDQTQLRLTPPYECWAIELTTSADYDDYWKHPSMNPSLYWDKYPEAATLYVGGWYDSYTRGTFESFTGHGEKTSSPVRVLVGPWTHGGAMPERSFAGDVEFGAEAALVDFRETHLGWFDAALKGADDVVQAYAPVRIFVMGGGNGQKNGVGRLVHGGNWRDEQEWPLARTQFTNFYLHGNGTLGEDAPSESSSSTTYRYDPSNPVPSIGGNVSSLMSFKGMPEGASDPESSPRALAMDEIMAPGGFDQIEGPDIYGAKAPYLPLGSRPDVLVFQTAPLEEDMEVTGPIEVRLWVSSSAVDTDFTAKLIDVYPSSRWYPEGYRLNLTDSIIRMRYRNGDGVQDFLTPGDSTEITITLYPTSNLFSRGHRIRLDVSSSNFPRFDVNTNTGEPAGRERRTEVADNTVFHESGRSSVLVLPVVPV
jgi:putative CocE/NonD family hydrolase